jgi:hypothetical protein
MVLSVEIISKSLKESRLGVLLKWSQVVVTGFVSANRATRDSTVIRQYCKQW